MRLEQNPTGDGLVIQLDFKCLTPMNWLQVDPICSHFRREVDGQSTTMSAEDWLSEILAPLLDASVPLEVGRLYEGARGTMAYGYFYHPLYALAQEQLFRTLEAACRAKCEQIGSSSRIDSFKGRIMHLSEVGLIPAGDTIAWHDLRGLRNETSHPRDHSLVLPPHAISTLREVTTKINSLYS